MFRNRKQVVIGVVVFGVVILAWRSLSGEMYDSEKKKKITQKDVDAVMKFINP